MFQRAFSVSTREQAALLFAPGGHSPTGVFVARCNIGTFVRLCFGVSCDICAGTFLLCDRGRGVAVVVTSWLWLCRVRRGRGCHALDVTPAVPCPGRRAVIVAAVAVASAVFVSPSCGCDTPMNASVSIVLHLDLRNKIVACILITTARRTAQRGTARPGERRSEPLRFDNSRADAMKIRRNAAGRDLTLKDRTAETSRSRNEWRGVRHGIAPRCMSGLQWPHLERM